MPIAKVAIPRPNVFQTWDYLVPGDLLPHAGIGKRVLVPIGNGMATGYITQLTDKAQTSREIKPVSEIIDTEPLVSKHMLELTRWISDYYVSSWGDVIKAALPAGINISETSIIRINSSGIESHEELLNKPLRTFQEGEILRLLDYLKEHGQQKTALLRSNFSGNLISTALTHGLIDSAKSRTGRSLEKYQLRLYVSDKPGHVPESFWKRSSKRESAYKTLMDYGKPVTYKQAQDQFGISRSVIKGLVEAGIITEKKEKIRRNPFKNLEIKMEDPHSLTELQNSVFSTISAALDENDFRTFLLHGITGSGKTEIYIHLALKCLQMNKQVLILIPELSLTPQFVRRYYSVFGEKLAVLHSALPLGERTDEWNRVRNGEVNVVLGTRLSIFAPLEKLGLIIVDEEHDQSYRQDDYPHFNARDIAVVRSQMLNAVCLLGSATPSIESLYNAKNGRYELLELKKRVFDRPLPELHCVDLRELHKEDESVLPAEVSKIIKSTLKKKQQTLIMAGRKGYAPFVICRACGNKFECPSCSISMVWHEKLGKLKCHYCSKTAPLKKICPHCGSTSISLLGVGTEKIERSVREQFPAACVERMDRDVVRKLEHYQKILDRLRERKTDILVGTQMIAKGHDYPGVTTVVAMGLDSLLKLPDFRHAERLFQLIVQISGRAGRGENPGSVYLLTYRPEHYAIQAAMKNDWELFLEKELRFRASLKYPPYGYIALLTIEDFNKQRGFGSAQKCVEYLYKLFRQKVHILGPTYAPYARLKNKWRIQIIIKATDRKELNTVLWDIRKNFDTPGSLKISVDPMSVM